MPDMNYRDSHFLTDPGCPDRFIDPPDEDPGDLAHDPLELVWTRSYGGGAEPQDVDLALRFHDRAAEWRAVGPPHRMIGRVFETGDVLLHPLGASGGFEADHPALRRLSREEVHAVHGMEDPVGPCALREGDVRCEVRLRITEPEPFRDHFGKEPEEISGEDLAGTLIHSYADDLDIGARLDGVEVAVDGKSLVVAILATIRAPDIFHLRAAAAGRQAGLDRDWAPKDAGEAIFEAFWGSNDSGSPADMGFEILDWRLADPESALGAPEI